MTTRKLALWVFATFVLFVVAACGSTSSSTGSSEPKDTSLAPVPLATFLQNVSHARYNDYAKLATTKVQNEQAFEEMRAYILNRYNGVTASSGYISNGQYFDCVVSNSKQTTPVPVSSPNTSQGSQGQGQSSTSTSTSCRAGTIPMQRITLEQMVQFPTLQAFLSKSPGGPSLPPTN